MPKRILHRKNDLLSPLVAVRGDRIDGALGAAGLERRKAAGRLKDLGIQAHAQTLDYIATGRQTSCRRDLVEALGELTNLPWQWLTGELERLPYVAQWDERSKRRGAFPGPRAAEAYVRQWRFLSQCVECVARDFVREFPDKSEGNSRWPGVQHGAVRLFTALSDPEHWMHRLLGWEETGPPAVVDEIEKVGGAVVGLVTAWEFALGPWFRGEVPLNYEALANLGEVRLLTAAADARSARPSSLLAIPRY